MFASFIILLFCWVSVSHSAPAPCERLVQRVENLSFQDVKGSWALVSVSAADPKYLEKMKRGNSGRGFFANYTDSAEISFTRISGDGDSCQYLQTNITLDGSSFRDHQLNITLTLLHSSCLDCMVMWLQEVPGQPLRLYLFSRRREVDAKEMEEFQAQAKCLNMSEHHVMDPTKKLCPEQMSRNAAASEATTAA